MGVGAVMQDLEHARLAEIRRPEEQDAFDVLGSSPRQLR